MGTGRSRGSHTTAQELATARPIGMWGRAALAAVTSCQVANVVLSVGP